MNFQSHGNLVRVWASERQQPRELSVPTDDKDTPYTDYTGQFGKWEKLNGAFTALCNHLRYHTLEGGKT